MKGYFDRILAYGFAYKTENGKTKGLLIDKKAIIINSTGTPDNIYQNNGFHKAMELLIDKGIFEFCGFKKTKHIFFGATPTASQETIKNYITKANAEVEKFIKE